MGSKPQIIPTAEPFFFRGDRTGCLLIHGFTGAPKEMRWQGEYLASRGYSVLGLRLAGHATRPADMLRSRWTDWLASVEDGYHLLRGVADRVYLVGLSLGGALSLLMSTRLEVRGVVAMSTPFKLPGEWWPNYIELLRLFRAYLQRSRAPSGGGWFDQEARRHHVSYPRSPVPAIGELHRLLAEMRLALPKVKVPVLLIHSRDDTSILPENMESIYAGLVNASDKEKLYITSSGHVVTRDAARHQVFEAVSEFIRRVESESK